MKVSNVRWTAVALIALIALPVSALAQTQPPTEPPTGAQSPASAQPSVNQDAAKRHLTAARDALSQMTQLQAAAQLTGDARTQVSQLINNFNELITTQNAWQESYAKVQANLAALLGSQTPDGSAKPPAGLDPLLQARLFEFRNHLENFERVAAGGALPEPTATPATPTAAPQPPSAQPPAPQPPVAPAGEPVLVDRQQALRHIQAIDAILSAQRPSGAVGTSGITPPAPAFGAAPPVVTLDRAQLDQLKSHLAELKRLMEKK